MKNEPGFLLLMIALAGCGGGKTSGEKACDDLSSKLAQCHLTIQGACNTSAPCAVECAVKAECSQLTAAPTGSYLQCVKVCSGAPADAFVCKDGRSYIPRAGVCNGRPECPDGSDEAACGGKDAGKDSGPG